MNNFIETLGIEGLVEQSGLAFSSNNFEDIYSAIHSVTELSELRKELEDVVSDHFSEMELPDCPTVYDHLVLSVLKKQGFRRNFQLGSFSCSSHSAQQ